MGPEWVSITALVALFVIGTVLPINMGALAYVAAWLVGMYSLHLDEKEILAGVSGDLILTLIGVTYLFAIAKNNGTVDLIVRSAVKAVGGRVALIPWVMFFVTALLAVSRRWYLTADREAPAAPKPPVPCRTVPTMGRKTGARASPPWRVISGMCLCERPSPYGRGAFSRASPPASYCSIIFLPPPE